MQKIFVALFVLYGASPLHAQEPDFFISAEVYECIFENRDKYLDRYQTETVIPVSRCPTIPNEDEPVDETVGDGPAFKVIDDKYDPIIFGGPDQLNCWFEDPPDAFTGAKLFLSSCSVVFETP